MIENEISLIIVEDDVLVAHNLKKNLVDLGFNVLKVCFSYEEGLEAIKEFNFDILLSDINIDHEHFTGIDLAKYAKQSKNIPTIFLTAYADKETIKNATQVFPAGYLVKPISIPSLFATIHNAIDNYTLNKRISLSEDLSPQNLFIYSKIGNHLRKIFWSDIYLISVVKNYVVLKTIDKHSSLIRSSLLNFTEKIIPKVVLENFTQISRNEMVNKKYIEKIEGSQIYICGEVHLMSSKYGI